MEKWKDADNYMGEDMSSWYVLISQTRDSGILEKSNFECILADLGGESETVEIHRFGHWGCGWIESIMIHESDTDMVARGNDIQAALDNYPVYDDEHFSMLEMKEKAELWQWFSIADRVEICQQAEINVFSARSENMPFDVWEYIEVDW